MYDLGELISILLNPIIPNATSKVLDSLSLKNDSPSLSFLDDKKILTDKIKVKDLNILFKKIVKW